MQSLAFLWSDMQMTQQYLREKTFGPAPPSANSANLNRPIDTGMLRRESVEQAPPAEPAKQRIRNERWTISPPRARAATKLIQQPKHP
jgi:hypothetical protein